MDERPTIAITMGDPAGVGPEVVVKALADAELRQKAKFIVYGMNELLSYAADLAELDVFWWRDAYNGRLKPYGHDVVVVDYDHFSPPRRAGGEGAEQGRRQGVDAVLPRRD